MNKIVFPTDVDIALTGRCNLRCKHCNTADTWDLQNELTTSEIFKVFDQLKENKIFRLSLFGGEPFSHPDILRILERLNEYPFSVSILTNATLIGPDVIPVLKKMKFLSKIQVSLDGSCAKIHDWQRGEGSFQKTFVALELLKEHGLPFSLKAIINDCNYRDIENLVLFAMQMGLKNVDFGDAVECGSAFKYKGNLRLSGQIYRETFSAMLGLMKKYPDFSFGGTFSQMLEMLQEFYEAGPEKGLRGKLGVCGAGFNMLSIRSDGEVVPCSSFWTLKCGNVRDKSLKEIWEDSEVLNDIRQLKDEPLSQYENCAKCDYLSYCNGGCRAAAYYSNGNSLRSTSYSTCVVFSDWLNQRLPKQYFFDTCRENIA
ncbi:MAG: radical SAM protein [Candidatus Omnitrophica bacterium]|nr:radical SAM protein [Candidatus Omnitrophota bacterium]